MYSSTCTDMKVCTWLKTLELLVYMIMYSSTCTDIKVCTWSKTLELVVYMIMYSSTCTDIQVCTWLKTLELVVYIVMYSSTCVGMNACTLLVFTVVNDLDVWIWVRYCGIFLDIHYDIVTQTIRLHVDVFRNFKRAIKNCWERTPSLSTRILLFSNSPIFFIWMDCLKSVHRLNKDVVYQQKWYTLNDVYKLAKENLFSNDTLMQLFCLEMKLYLQGEYICETLKLLGKYLAQQHKQQDLNVKIWQHFVCYVSKISNSTILNWWF
jgi:hypothetical protein